MMVAKYRKIAAQKAKEQKLLEQTLKPLARRFMRDNIKLLLEGFSYDYSWLIDFYEEFDHELLMEVVDFEEYIAPDYSFINKFMAYPPLVDKLIKLGIDENNHTEFLYYLKDFVCEKDYFSRLQLRLELKKYYPEGIVVEHKRDGYFMSVILPEDKNI